MRLLFFLCLSFAAQAQANSIGRIVEANCKLKSPKPDITGEVHLKRVLENEAFDVQLGNENWSLEESAKITINEDNRWNYFHGAVQNNGRHYFARLAFGKTTNLEQQPVEAALVLSADFMISYTLLCSLTFRDVNEAPVCSRTSAIVTELENILGKQCSEITADDLATVQQIELKQDVSSGSLKRDDFAGLINLEKLDLGSTNLATFPLDLFTEIPQLKELTLDGNPIKNLPDGVFKDLKNLETLNLRRSFYFMKDFRLTETTFTGLQNLTTLNLDSYPQDFEDFVFRQLSSLRHLDINSGSIRKITENTFAGLGKLESLNLWQSQNLKEISPLAFQHLTNLKDLNIGNNGLKTIPDDLLHPLRNLQNLKMVGINSLNDQSFATLKNLKSLRLVFSEATAVDHILDPLENLEDLYFGARQLNNFSGQIFGHLKKLKKLKITVGAAFHLPDYSFSHLENLEELDLALSFKSLTISDYTFTGLKKLRKLSLRGNRLFEFIPWSFNDLTSLEVLDLSENQISHVFGLSLNSLKELYLNQNLLDVIDKEAFRDFKNLQILRLSSNKIRYIQNGTFAALENIKRLELSSNSLENVTKETVNGINIDKLEFIDFVYNPLTEQSKKFLKTHFGKKVRTDSTTL